MTPWSDPNVENFRAELSTVFKRYSRVLDSGVMTFAAQDIITRFIVPGAEMPEALTAADVVDRPGAPTLEPAA